LVADSLDEALDFVNAYATEHLEIVTREPESILERVKHAGAVFLGGWSPVAAGDYASGGNHTLPTAGYARAFGPLSVEAFGRRMQVQQLEPSGLAATREAIDVLAEIEGLPLHARSIDTRFAEVTNERDEAHCFEADGNPRPVQGASGRTQWVPTDERHSAIRRVTGETDVSVEIDLDRKPVNAGSPVIATGVAFFDHMLTAFAFHGRISLTLTAAGDREIDDHHTVEDCGIVLGQALLAALGERRGIERFGYAYAPLDESLARAVIDISGRPFFLFDLGPVRLPERIGGFESQLVEEFWRAVATEARLTLHLDLIRGRNGHHAVEALFKAAGVALRQAIKVSGAAEEARVPSTKGVLG
ncbi:MAG TPA: imidazoleglycerol-phosphate dehydratase HisB, partial [Thermomicrobiaceae bacterium]|nr:imidazoleglycerol-phosphate dehydratase HisB [Thermomicrobiaceae bacterium]